MSIPVLTWHLTPASPLPVYVTVAHCNNLVSSPVHVARHRDITDPDVGPKVPENVAIDPNIGYIFTINDIATHKGRINSIRPQPIQACPTKL